MIRERLYELVSKRRKDIETWPSDKYLWRNNTKGRFPRGKCGDASDHLAQLILSKLNLPSEYVSGVNGGRDNELSSHAWLECEGLVIDITADQFNDRGYDLDSVYVDSKNHWYDTFTIESTRQIK